MTDNRLTVRERVYAVDSLDWLARHVNHWASYLPEAGFETESDKIELAAVHLAAACHLLERRIRPALPPERWRAPEALSCTGSDRLF